jgi:hypothetical protein
VSYVRLAVPLAAAATLALSGCGVTDAISGSPASPSPSVVTVTAPPPASAPSSTTTTPAADDPTTAASGGDAAAPAQAGKNTNPGTTLALGQPATLDYESGDDKTKLQVKPTKIKQGTIADFGDYELDAVAKASTPFFVTVEYHNYGPGTLKYPYLNVKLDAYDSNGDKANKMIASGLSACREDQKPSTFKKGDDVTECAVFMLPKGAKLGGVSWSGNFTDDAVKWRAP